MASEKRKEMLVLSTFLREEAQHETRYISVSVIFYFFYDFTSVCKSYLIAVIGHFLFLFCYVVFDFDVKCHKYSKPHKEVKLKEQ